MQHTAAVRLARLGGSVMASYMDAWAALCTALGHVLRIRIVCAVLLRTNSRLCPSSREPWRPHCDGVSSIV